MDEEKVLSIIFLLRLGISLRCLVLTAGRIYGALIARRLRLLRKLSIVDAWWQFASASHAWLSGPNTVMETSVELLVVIGIRFVQNVRRTGHLLLFSHIRSIVWHDRNRNIIRHVCQVNIIEPICWNVSFLFLSFALLTSYPWSDFALLHWLQWCWSASQSAIFLLHLRSSAISQIVGRLLVII